MSAATLLTEEVWKPLTAVIRHSKVPCQIAVAYLGSGASRMLPVRAGSVLVVDASLPAVKSGATCPNELLKLLKNKKTEIYSCPNLHAKVFVVGDRAFIGSANASNHSKNTLVEALIETDEKQIVKKARKFIHDHCFFKLMPEQLKKLAQQYRPPKTLGSNPMICIT